MNPWMKTTLAGLVVAGLALGGCSSDSTTNEPTGSSSGSSSGASSGSSGTSGSSSGTTSSSSGTSGVPTNTTLFRSWSASDTGTSWNCSYAWRAIDLEGGHYGDGNSVILEDTTSDRCIMVGNIVKSAASGSVEMGTITLTEKEMCRGIGSIGLVWSYSYSLDTAAGVLTLSSSVCAVSGRPGGGTMAFD